MGAGSERPPTLTSNRSFKGRPFAVLGTASHVGKSLVSAGLCRALARRGVRVAPFKAVNMSNNAWVTAGGAEIGHAQAIQAEAAGVEPETDMNPVLLKPTADRGVQVVVHGRALGHVLPGRWSTRVQALWPQVVATARRLLARYDVVVIEGMGAAAEPNLMRKDLANIRLARKLQAPVLLVGSAEYGGVFGTLAGTVSVMSREDRRQVRGFLINRMYGNAKLLGSAPGWLRQKTGIPVAGVMPYLPDLGFPEEDDPPPTARNFSPAGRGRLRVEVIRLPGIANFTDLEPLGRESDVDLVYVDRPQVRMPAVIILPGSKNTMAALRMLRERRLDRYVRDAVRAGVHVVGLCGGYQMLGIEVRDPDSIESGVRRSSGLGLLPVVTRFQSVKTTRRVRARHLRSGLTVDGYEIHMGQSLVRGGRPAFDMNGTAEGCENTSGRVWGAYLHGLFDSPNFRRWFLDRVRLSRDLNPIGRLARPERERRLVTYDRIADALDAMPGIQTFLRLVDSR